MFNFNSDVRYAVFKLLPITIIAHLRILSIITIYIYVIGWVAVVFRINCTSNAGKKLKYSISCAALYEFTFLYNSEYACLWYLLQSIHMLFQSAVITLLYCRALLQFSACITSAINPNTTATVPYYYKSVFLLACLIYNFIWWKPFKCKPTLHQTLKHYIRHVELT